MDRVGGTGSLTPTPAAPGAAPVEILAAVELLWGMRLTRKFIAALVIGVAIVGLIQAYLDDTREREVFDRQMQGEAKSLGRVAGRGVADVWTRDGEAAARQFLESSRDRKSTRLNSSHLE